MILYTVILIVENEIRQYTMQTIHVSKFCFFVDIDVS